MNYGTKRVECAYVTTVRWGYCSFMQWQLQVLRMRIIKLPYYNSREYIKSVKISAD
jgi:hypothetical protein